MLSLLINLVVVIAISVSGSYWGARWALKDMRQAIKDEFNKFFQPEVPRETLTIKNPTGAELIMPNPIKEAFDEGRVKSIGDIV